MTIKEFNYFMNRNKTNLSIDWIRLLQTVFNFKVEKDFQIFVENRDLVSKTMDIFDQLDDRHFANIFNTEFMTAFRRVFALYYISDNERTQWGIEKAQQRFEQCIRIARESLPVAFTSLLIKRYTNPKMIESAYEVGNRTMKNIVNHVANDTTLPKEHRDIMVEKLKSAKLIIGYPAELLSNKTVKSFYKDFNITGDENFLKLTVDSFLFYKDFELRKFETTIDGKLVREESTKWADYTLEDEYETPFYFFDTNVICKLSSDQR